ncbi:YjbQ family protein [archaeon]|nr:YjbQ family protein [archaeon]
MGVFRKSVKIKTKGLNDFANITEDVEDIVKESEIKNGMVFLNSLHNTAALVIQEDDATIHRDLINTLERIAPLKGKYEHNMEGSENAIAHLTTNLGSSNLAIPLEDGKLILGIWQQIFFVELFEPREREVVVTIIGE